MMMLKLVFFVPIESAEDVKGALFSAGAGQHKALGSYEKCSFETLGVGQFRPVQGANPHLGEVGQVKKIEELRVEMLLDERVKESVVSALKESHPYEVVAYEIYQVFQ